MLDAVVVGGGAAGLALVAHLAAGGWDDRRVVLVDDPSPTDADRCWGSWSRRPRLTAVPGGPGFERVRVHAHGRDLTVDLAPYRYRLVTGTALRAAVDALTAGAPGFERVEGRCTAIVDGADGACVVVAGRTLRARWVFDSTGTWTPPLGRRRPPAAPAHRMVFTGWHVTLPADTVDPDVPVLCDFRVPPGHAAFVHVLPAGARRALVEHTAYVSAGTPAPAPGATAAALRGYVRGVLGATDGAQVERYEHGVIPLQARPPRRRGRHVLAIGAAAGLVRASSGYGFEAVHRDAAAVARSLAVHDHPFDVPPPRRRDTVLDALFLRALARDPRTLERAFGALFATRDPVRVLRFLDGDATAADVVRMVAGLPPLPFLRALLPVPAAAGPPAGPDAGGSPDPLPTRDFRSDLRCSDPRVKFSTIGTYDPRRPTA